MSHHIDLAEKVQTRPSQTEIATIFFFFYLYSLKSIFQSSVQQYVRVEGVGAKGNTPALIQ